MKGDILTDGGNGTYSEYAVPSVQGVSVCFDREGGRSSRYSELPEWITLTVYAALVAFAIPFHEPFVDEAAVVATRSEPVAHDLFQTYLRYEGSPGLWHFLLWILVRLHISYTRYSLDLWSNRCSFNAILVPEVSFLDFLS